MGEWSDSFTRELLDGQRDTMERMGQQVTEDLRQTLSVPVERTGSRYVRSLPGEAPRQEGGSLQQDTQYEVAQDAATVALEVFWTLPYAPMLEDGTSRMEARPFAQPAFESWSDPVAEACEEAAAQLK